MKVQITDPAKEELKKIYNYYRRIGLGKIGRKIRKEVVSRTLVLKQQPNLGQIEENLKELDQGHRYLVVGNYKVIYKIEGKIIYITDVFDTRQDPSNIKP